MENETQTIEAPRTAEQVQAEFDQFKRKVAEVTDRYARAHNLCPVVDRALGELGLQRPKDVHRCRAALVVEWDYEASDGHGPSDEQMWESLRAVASSIINYGVERTGPRMQGGRPNLVIGTAEVSSAPITDSASSHILPGGPTLLCVNCGRAITARNGVQGADGSECDMCY